MININFKLKKKLPLRILWLKFLNEHLKINKTNFFDQHIETRLTKSHSRSRKIFPVDFFLILKFP